MKKGDTRWEKAQYVTVSRPAYSSRIAERVDPTGAAVTKTFEITAALRRAEAAVTRVEERQTTYQTKTGIEKQTGARPTADEWEAIATFIKLKADFSRGAES